MTSIAHYFDVNGLLAQKVEGYLPRQPQLEMAYEIEQAIKQQNSLIVEAATGTGKTLAYLVPAFIAATQQPKQRVVISTGTKNLQQQLLQKDVPIVQSLFAEHHVDLALLKGRSNYLCLHRLDEYQQHRGTLDASMLQDLVKVRNWRSVTRTGDIAELEQVAEDAAIFPYITSTVDNCLGKDCPQFEQCFLVKARERALAADIIIINHHLFFADMAIKENGFGELVPSAQVYIFDEAHQLPDIACQYFGEHLSTRQLLELCHDVIGQYRTELTDVKQLEKAANKVIAHCRDLRLMLPHEPTKGHWHQLVNQAQFHLSFSNFLTDVDFLHQVLQLVIGRNKTIDQCYERSSHFIAQLSLFKQATDTETSLWFETSARHLVLHQTPLSVAKPFQQFYQQHQASWIFTSATLAINGSFTHFSEQFSLHNTKSMLLESPFDYQTQSQLLVPRFLPSLQSNERAQALTEVAITLIEASNAACLMLFTSFQMMHQVADALAEQFNGTVLVQGQMAKSALLRQFISTEHTVLLATASFWEGIDIKGDNLTCVIIDKLPFTAPDEPLLQAKSHAISQKGGDPFWQLQLPQAVIALKQGVGRLIRDAHDRGIMVICDDRLVNKEYGRVFLSSLPPMKRTRDLQQAEHFLKQITQQQLKETINDLV